MAIVLTGRTRSFRMLGLSPVTKVRIKITEISPSQRVLAAQGITDVVDGTLIQPISAKYPGLGLLRWVNAGGAIQGVEQRVEFPNTDFFPPSSSTVGFEIYVTLGTVFDAEIENGGEIVDLTQYYTKTEVNALLAGLPPQVDAYTKAQVNTLLALKQDTGSYYTQAQVNALIPTSFRSFDYDQSGVPSNPTTGKTWRERDGSNNILMDWFYDSTGVWRSLDLRIIKFDGSFTATNFVYGLPLPRSTYSYFIPFISIGRVSSGLSSVNYWKYFCKALVQTGSNPVSIGTEVNGSTDNTSSQWEVAQQTPNAVVTQAQTFYFRLDCTKVGTPNTGTVSAALYYRYQRP